MTNENELARRRRINQQADALAEHLRIVLEISTELLDELEVDDRDMGELIERRLSEADHVALARLALVGDARIDPISQGVHRMSSRIRELLDAAPKLEDAAGAPVAGQTPAIEAHVILRPGMTLQGSLSVTESGGLRLLTPTTLAEPTRLNPQATRIVLAETYFDAADVVAVAVKRDVEATPGIITS